MQSLLEEYNAKKPATMDDVIALHADSSTSIPSRMEIGEWGGWLL